MNKTRSGPVSVLLLILLIPILWLNVKDSHDWGDDFAQYFIQAKNILEGKPQHQNGLVFDLETGAYALQAYPAGFPLLLAASWSFSGQSIVASSILISVFLVGFGCICFFFFNKYFDPLISLFLVLLIIYNPFTLGFKKEILSDIPFSFLLLASILLFQKNKKSILFFVLTGILWGFTMSVRGIGLVLLMAAGFYLLHNTLIYFRSKINRIEWVLSLKKVTVITLIALLFYQVLNGFIFDITTQNFLSYYSEAMKGQNVFYWLRLNTGYYYDVYLNFYANLGGSWQWLASATKYTMLLLVFPGMIISFYKRPRFDDWVFVSYVIVLFIYPYLGGGFRFLIPVIPFFMKYSAVSLRTLFDALKVNSTIPSAVFLAVVLLQYIPGVIGHAKSIDIPEQGPQGNEAILAFDAVNRLPADAVVVFIKPRALSYYTNKRAAYIARNVSQSELQEIFQRMEAHYFMICHENEEVYDGVLKKFIEDHKDRLTLVYSNKLFDIYSDK